MGIEGALPPASAISDPVKSITCRFSTSLNDRRSARLHNASTSSRGKGAWPATVAAAGSDRAGRGPRGILGRSGDELAGLTRPPSAWTKVKGYVLACSGPPSSTSGLSGNGESRVPVRPEQGHPTGRWRITIARSVGLRRNGNLQTHIPDAVRRSASLSTNFSGWPREAADARLPQPAAASSFTSVTPSLTWPPATAVSSATTPSNGAARACSIFMASRVSRV
jgi:hypothetical protein